MGNKRVSRFLRHHRGLLQDTRKRTVHVTNSYAGVEYLLRDVKDTTISTLATEVSAKLTALKGLDARLKEIRSYLDLVIDGKLPLNHAILYHLQAWVCRDIIRFREKHLSEGTSEVATE